MSVPPPLAEAIALLHPTAGPAAAWHERVSRAATLCASVPSVHLPASLVALRPALIAALPTAAPDPRARTSLIALVATAARVLPAWPELAPWVAPVTLTAAGGDRAATLELIYAVLSGISPYEGLADALHAHDAATRFFPTLLAIQVSSMRRPYE